MQFKKMISFCWVLSAMLPFTNVAQQPLSPAWTMDAGAPVLWQKVTDLGLLVASTPKGLIGINTSDGKVMWTLDALKNCPEDGYQEIPRSPFIGLAAAGASKSLYIVDPLAGKIVFSTAEAGLEQVTDRYFLYQSAKILVIGTGASAKAATMVMVDMATGKKLWDKSGAYGFTTGVKDLGSDKVLITSAFFASMLNAADGTEVWKSVLDPKTAGMSGFLGTLEGLASKKLSKDDVMAQLITTEMQPDIFILAAQKKNESTKVDSKGNKTVSVTYTSVYMAFETATGTHKWSQVIEMPFQLGVSYPAEKGLVVSSANGGNINLLQYSDGTKMFGKRGSGLSIKGTATGFVPLDANKLLISSDAGNSSALTLLDLSAGTLVFDKSAKLKGTITYTELLPAGVLACTDQAVNLYNTSTGDWAWEKSPESNPGLVASDDKQLYLFNNSDHLLYSMDIGGNTLKAVSTAPLVFQGKEEPTGIEIRDDGILVSSEQNLALIGANGSITYNTYFPAPGVSGFRKALLIASAVRAAYYTAAYATYSAAFGAASQSIQVKDARSKATKDVTGAVSQALGDAAVTGAGYTAAYIKMAQQRFKATADAQDYMIIMTAESKKDIRLLQVKKTDGKVAGVIALGSDKQPVYDLDLVEGKIYYMKTPSKMESYRL